MSLLPNELLKLYRLDEDSKEYKQSQDQLIDIFVTLTIPRKYYDFAASMLRIHDYKNFDSYVSDTIAQDILGSMDEVAIGEQVCKKLK